MLHAGFPRLVTSRLLNPVHVTQVSGVGPGGLAYLTLVFVPLIAVLVPKSG